MTSKIIRVISWGGLGDALLATPSFKAIKKKHTNCKVIVYCMFDNHLKIYRHNPYIDSLRSADFFKSPVSWLLYRTGKAKFYRTSYGILKPGINYEHNAKEIIAEMLDVELQDKRLEIFLTPSEEAKAKTVLAPYTNPVTFNPSARYTNNKEWKTGRWAELIKAMPEYSFIQIGQRNEPFIEGAIDLRDKVTLRESIAVIKHSLGYIGVDSFWAHACSAVDTPGIILFGPTSPTIYGHENNINLSKRLYCSPCIDTLLDAPCPYGRKCMEAITADDVRQAARLHFVKAKPGIF